MDDAWSDTDISLTPPHSSNFLFTESPPPSSSTLGTYQNNLISAYTYHSDRVSDLMNTVVDLDISVRRERDEPSLQCLTQELENAQEDLVQHRGAKGKKGREMKKEEEEEETLRMVVGNESILAKRQLNEIRTYIGRERMAVCLR